MRGKYANVSNAELVHCPSSFVYVALSNSLETINVSVPSPFVEFTYCSKRFTSLATLKRGFEVIVDSSKLASKEKLGEICGKAAKVAANNANKMIGPSILMILSNIK